ncbi:hypothetical protein B0I35DRAFT_406067 [Stachybotrys elegans]|uniref:FAS1 domain-containing protein n=1 Tax=Stachybotrys elegans TaxID=80388 RepID=A0A8K0SWN1_9HYPO|nr:hypothetical protein B0I35DRAFT_406067 [Stachybotrys elegans]
MKPSSLFPLVCSLVATVQAAAIGQTKSLIQRDLPPGVPSVIQPSTPAPVPAGTTEIQIGFLNSLNYVFVANTPSAALQIFSLLPQVLAQAAGVSTSSITVNRLAPLDTGASLGYFTTLAKVHYPQNLIQTLQLQIQNPNSPLYQQQNSNLRSLVQQINPSINILGNN